MHEKPYPFPSVEAATRKPAGTIRFAAFLFILSGGIALTTPLVLLSFDRNGYLPEAPFDLEFELLAGPFSENLTSGPFITLGVVLTAVSLLDVSPAPCSGWACGAVGSLAS
jgi:hypothetical protein